MRTQISRCLWVLAVSALNLLADGFVYFGSQTAPTRLGTPEGPRAGTNILSQLLVGTEAGKLIPFGNPQVNFSGVFVVTPISVSLGNPGTLVLVQLAAWDKSEWGVSYTGVPEAAKGFTDVISYHLDSKPANPPYITFFTQPAVVPSSVPEPGEIALFFVWVVGICVFTKRQSTRGMSR